MTTSIAYIHSKTRYEPQDLKKWAQLVTKELSGVTYTSYNTIQELFPKLSDPFYHVDFINIHLEILEDFNVVNPYALVSTLKTLSSSTLRRDPKGKTIKRETKILGVVGHNTPVELIKEMLPIVDGLCLHSGGDWTVEMVLQDQKKLISGDLSIPKEIQSLLKKKKAKKDDVIKLTPRQKQVFTLVVKRGVSNKIIAKTLNISESTVKLHVGAILRKYGLKNRTQLAVFAKETES